MLTYAGLPYTIYMCTQGFFPLPNANAKNTTIWSTPADPPNCSTNKGKNIPKNESRDFVC